MMRAHRPHRLPRLTDGTWDRLKLNGTERRVIRAARTCYAKHGLVSFGYSELAAYPVPLLYQIVTRAVLLDLLPNSCEFTEHGLLEEPDDEPDAAELAEIEERMRLLRAAKEIAAWARGYGDDSLFSWEMDAILDSDRGAVESPELVSQLCPDCGRTMSFIGRAGRGRRCYHCKPSGPGARSRRRSPEPCLA